MAAREEGKAEVSIVPYFPARVPANEEKVLWETGCVEPVYCGVHPNRQQGMGPNLSWEPGISRSESHQSIKESEMETWRPPGCPHRGSRVSPEALRFWQAYVEGITPQWIEMVTFPKACAVHGAHGSSATVRRGRSTR